MLRDGEHQQVQGHSGSLYSVKNVGGVYHIARIEQPVQDLPLLGRWTKLCALVIRLFYRFIGGFKWPSLK